MTLELLKKYWNRLRLNDYEDWCDVMERVLSKAVKEMIMAELKPHLKTVHMEYEVDAKQTLVSILDAYEDGADKEAVIQAIEGLHCKGDPDLATTAGK